MGARSRNLLIVVDDWEALDVYEELLGSKFSLVSAPFGSEGVRMARDLSNERRPDRILLDLTLEDMHASEACEKLRAREETRTIPVTVVLNAEEPAFERPGVFPLPGDQLLRRPYQPAQLVELLCRDS